MHFVESNSDSAIDNTDTRLDSTDTNLNSVLLDSAEKLQKMLSANLTSSSLPDERSTVTEYYKKTVNPENVNLSEIEKTRSDAPRNTDIERHKEANERMDRSRSHVNIKLVL